MNCPSRTDDVEFEHPTWNQNPPFLAADLTTRQDLNGIANSREHKEGIDEGPHDLAPASKTTLFDRPPDCVASEETWARLSSECRLFHFIRFPYDLCPRCFVRRVEWRPPKLAINTDYMFFTKEMLRSRR